MIQWSEAQAAALEKALAWLEAPGAAQVFRIFGYAGTGKTTLARAVAERAVGKVLFGAYTGKAALVLRKRGCWEAQTIHSMIYTPLEKSRLHLLELQEELAHLGQPRDEDRARELRREIQAEEENLRRPSFSLNLASEVRNAACVVVDEVSMVGQQMGEDLLHFGTPVLVLGDTAQLPPVADGGYFTREEPDVMLTEIHRQAEGSPIINMATAVREKRALHYGEYRTSSEHAASQVVPFGTLSIQELMRQFDQVLCGRNKTRQDINRRFREAAGRKGHLPEPGDRLVCLRNNRENGLLNGSLWDVIECRVLNDDRLSLTLRDQESDVELDTEAHRQHFEGRAAEMPYWERRDADEFEYGFALTVHKAQGSQWPRVCIVNEAGCFGADAARWLYTGITRAEEHVTVIQ